MRRSYVSALALDKAQEDAPPTLDTPFPLKNKLPSILISSFFLFLVQKNIDTKTGVEDVSPVIDPHFFRDSVITDEGLRTKFMCVVTKGDPPLRFHWLKNGLPFLAHGDTTVQTFEDSSIVTFKRVSSSDRGHYTCIAANMASSTNLTTQLIVNGKKIRLFSPI
ncbi:down syndrome cell adhesion molecule-like protein Dscam2 [Caerostris extrusa]|uniref:Down syndrome cell adhesion molecule-like protein Dscam2 n=1 Tax=Caerostris extrusa TaxID=172846 RepID=A0AAV4WXU9_CAEEX|nr:down syndrome cell adhesion molecule-like protein Dscam2 [Caerostris extrusa]